MKSIFSSIKVGSTCQICLVICYEEFKRIRNHKSYLEPLLLVSLWLEINNIVFDNMGYPLNYLLALYLRYSLCLKLLFILTYKVHSKNYVFKTNSNLGWREYYLEAWFTGVAMWHISDWSRWVGSTFIQPWGDDPVYWLIINSTSLDILKLVCNFCGIYEYHSYVEAGISRSTCYNCLKSNKNLLSSQNKVTCMCRYSRSRLIPAIRIGMSNLLGK